MGDNIRLRFALLVGMLLDCFRIDSVIAELGLARPALWPPGLHLPAPVPLPPVSVFLRVGLLPLVSAPLGLLELSFALLAERGTPCLGALSLQITSYWLGILLRTPLSSFVGEARIPRDFRPWPQQSA